VGAPAQAPVHILHKSLKSQFSSSFHCTPSHHAAMSLPGFELFPLQKNFANSPSSAFFPLHTLKCLIPRPPPAGPSSTTGWEQAPALKYIRKAHRAHQKCHFLAEKVMRTTDRQHSSSSCEAVPDLRLLPSTCGDDTEQLQTHLYHCLSAFPLRRQSTAEAPLRTPDPAG